MEVGWDLTGHVGPSSYKAGCPPEFFRLHTGFVKKGKRFTAK